MLEKIYLILLFICGILSQEVIGRFSEKNIRKSSYHLLLRNKRLISNQAHQIVRTSLTQAPYVVQLLRNNFYVCVGNIILPRVILTVAHCLDDPGTYSILSGSARVLRGTHHNITVTVIHPQYNPSALIYDLALLYINPHIDIIHSSNRPIRMHHGLLHSRTVGHISSWGCIGEDRNELILPHLLRSITTEIISQEECHHIQNSHEHHPVAITDENICTYDIINGNRCHLGDSGAPLVVSNELAGILAWTRTISHSPDIFLNLSHPLHRSWILENLPPNPSNPSYTRNL